MEWFKHYAKSNQNAKIRRLKNKYGIAAYGLYFHIQERIMMECGRGNVTLKLEDDFFILEQDTGIEQSDLRNIIYTMVELGLLYCDEPQKLASPEYDLDDIFISCPRLAKSLDKSQVSPSMRHFVDQLHKQHEEHYD